MLIQVVEYHFGDFVLLQFDGDAHAVTIGFVTQIGNTFKLFIAHHMGDIFDQIGFIHLIRQFGNDQRFALGARVNFHHRPGSHGDRTSTTDECLLHTLATINKATGRKIGAGHNLH